MTNEVKKEDHSVNKTVININSSRSIFAFVCGVVFILIGVALILLPLTPYLFKVAIPSEPIIPTWTGWAFLGGGLLLVFNPQKLITIISKKGGSE